MKNVAMGLKHGESFRFLHCTIVEVIFEQLLFEEKKLNFEVKRIFTLWILECFHKEVSRVNVV